MASKYLFLTSTDGLDVYPQNNCTDFTVDFPNPIELNSDKTLIMQEWHVALIDININLPISLKNSVIVMCDLVENSYIKGKRLPLLRILPGAMLDGASLHIPYYMKLNTTSFRSLRIYLLDINFESIENEISEDITSTCTLHFLPHH